MDAAFSTLGLDWHQHVTIDEELFLPTDLEMSLADPVKATLRLGWTAERRMVDVVRLMLSAAEAVAE